jgi:DNA-binding MarR family transcriptional regulator
LQKDSPLIFFNKNVDMSTKSRGWLECDGKRDDILLFHLGAVNRILFKRANRYLTNSGYAVRAEQIPLLMVLYMEGPQSQQALAEETGRDKASVLRTIRLLSEYGYVQIGDDPTDKRKHTVELTGSGTELMSRMLQNVMRVDRILFSAIGENDKKKLIRIMSKVSNRLKD